MSNDAPPAHKPISFQKQMTKAYQNPLPCWKRISGMAPIPAWHGRKPCHFIFIWMLLVPLAIKKTERMSILKALFSSRLCRRHPSVFAILSASDFFCSKRRRSSMLPSRWRRIAICGRQRRICRTETEYFISKKARQPDPADAPSLKLYARRSTAFPPTKRDRFCQGLPRSSCRRISGTASIRSRKNMKEDRTSAGNIRCQKGTGTPEKRDAASLFSQEHS